MKKIKTRADLLIEKSRLKLEIAATEEKLHDDMEWIKEELQPVKIAGRIFSNAMIDKNKGGFVNNGVRFSLDALLKGVILSKSGWITRLVVPFVIKNLSSNFIAEKKPEIFGILRNLIHKVRKTTAHSNNHKDNYYDKSTVDEMEY